MKQYTGMFIIRPTLTEDGYKEVVQSILIFSLVMKVMF